MPKKYPQGSSLAELLISIGILGLIVAISIPHIRTSISGITLANTAKEIVTDLRDAQQRTVSEQTLYYVQFLEDQNKYRLIKESTSYILKEKTLPAEIDFYAISGFTDNKAKFNYFGAAIEAGTVTLLHTSTDATSIIEIKPSGYVNYN
ncbi:MAG: hypothetical protein V1770_00710 [bacterium]